MHKLKTKRELEIFEEWIQDWEANMKQRVQWLIDDNDDYQMFEWAFKQL